MEGADESHRLEQQQQWAVAEGFQPVEVLVSRDLVLLAAVVAGLAEEVEVQIVEVAAAVAV